jgi:hypothetical protein
MASPPTVNCSAVADGARAMMMGLSAVPKGTTGASSGDEIKMIHVASRNVNS